MNVDRRSSRIGILMGVALSSASGLAFEIALTRVFAITQFYHFAFLTVSMALLGFGASGSFLAAFPKLAGGRSRRWSWLALVQALATIGAYAGSNAVPFDSFAIASDRWQFVYLGIYYLLLSLPFFFGGLIVAVLLAAAGKEGAPASNVVYGASLVGSGVGCVAAVIVLDQLGGEGTIAAAAAVAATGGVAFAVAGRHRDLSLIAAVLVVILLVVATFVPSSLEMRLSPYKSLSGALRFPGATIAATEWDRGTRVDLVLSEGVRSLPGLSFAFRGTPPLQAGLTFDGDDLSPVIVSGADDPAYASHMLSALAWQLRPGAVSLILEPRGGLDIEIARANGAASVTAVEPHGAVIDLAALAGSSVYMAPEVAVVIANPRAYVQRTDDHFDVLDLALTAPYRPVTSGAYSLVEDYSLTVEAFGAYLDRLAPDGILTAMRWLQTPPSEEIRLLVAATAAVRDREVDPVDAVVMLRNYSNALLLVQLDGWSAWDLARIREFAVAERFDIVAMPGLQADETNRFSVLPDDQYSELAGELLRTVDPDAVYDRYEYAIAPPTDDHPFFGHYFRWGQTGDVLARLGQKWQPFGGAGYLVILLFLGIAVVAAVALILAPLVIGRGRLAAAQPGVRSWTVAYFGCLGLAFLLVEIPLVQLYILLIGDPTNAFAVVLFSVLLASGVGAVVAPRIPWRSGGAALSVLAVGYPFLIGWATGAVLPLPIAARVAAGAVLIVPLGLLMGTMFPNGIALLERVSPRLVPWAWGINGTLSVISAVVAALLALTFGFRVVLLLGAAAYALATLLAGRAGSLAGSREGHEQHAAEVLTHD